MRSINARRTTDADPGTALAHRHILALALPIMAANISTPLLGMVDTAVVGQLPDPANIGAVALGALVFSFLFWAFGFLRMGTTGLTAQAVGAGVERDVAAGLLRALLVAVAAGAALIVLQWPLGAAALALLDAPARVEALVGDYFSIRIFAAPATLANYALLGWFVGLGRTRTALVLQLVLNLSNIALDALFVLVFEWGVSGVAAGTLVAEYLAAGVGLVLARSVLRELGVSPSLAEALDTERLGRMLKVNRDIMVRSLSLLAVFVWFMSESARAGAVVLAANAVLMNFVSAAAYVLDGLAHTAETLVGRACGRGARGAFVAAARLTTAWAVVLAVASAVLLGLAGDTLIALMTVSPATRATAAVYLPWVVAAPLLGVWAFQLDGIFIGATHTVEMRRAMLVALAVFVPAWYLLRPFGNHGLWAALSVHYLARAVSLGVYYPRLLRKLR